MPVSLSLNYQALSFKNDLALSPFNGLKGKKTECVERHCLPSNWGKPEFLGETTQFRELKVVEGGKLTSTLIFSEFTPLYFLMKVNYTKNIAKRVLISTSPIILYNFLVFVSISYVVNEVFEEWPQDFSPSHEVIFMSEYLFSLIAILKIYPTQLIGSFVEVYGLHLSKWFFFNWVFELFYYGCPQASMCL